MLRQYKLKDYKFRLVLWVLILSVIGIMVIGSANSNYQMKQMIGMGVGIVFMIMVSLMDYLWISNFYWIYYIGGLVLLIAVRFFGTEVNGAKRWIDFGGFSFQPSDIMKIVVIIFFTRFFMKHEEDLNKPQTILKAVGLVAIPWFFIYKQPDLSTSIVVLLIFCTIYFIAGLSSKIIGGMILICIPLVVIGAMLVTQPDQKILKGYQHDRIMGWLQPEKYPDISYQQTNSKIAIGSGQLYGKGLNNSDVNSVKNGNFIAEPQTDFIFAVAGEEYGFLGCSLIILLLLAISIECVRMGLRAKDLSGKIICCGMASVVALQSFLNISVATGIAPNTGTPLPFVSYGLTSLVSLYIGMGLVLNVGLQSSAYNKEIRKNSMNQKEDYL